MEDVKVFISHRHDDKAIADVINTHLQEWGVPKKSIFLSSQPEQGADEGEILTSELLAHLDKVNLMILVYTFADDDWSYCMWECGIATGKSTTQTRIAIFQCTQDVPRVFQDKTRILVTPDGITGFVTNFYKTVAFIPGLSNEAGEEIALQPDVSGKIIEYKSSRLYEDLNEVVPTGKLTSTHLWDFVRLRLDKEYIDKIESAENKNEIMSTIRDGTEVLEPLHTDLDNSLASALRQFGFQSYEKGLKLSDLLGRWEEKDETKKSPWIDDLYDAIYRAVTNSPSASVSNCFKSVREDTDWWFYPAVTRVRSFPDDSMEFDVYLIRTDPTKHK